MSYLFQSRRAALQLIVAGIGAPFLQSNTPACADATIPNFLPFDRADVGTGSRKVFAHWHVYPISVDNLPANRDFYETDSLNPKDSSGKYRDFGSSQRERPFPRSPRQGADWTIEDMAFDIRLADAIGVDGFLFNIVNIETTSWFWRNLIAMLDAAERVGGDFKVVPNLDLAVFKDAPVSNVAAALKSLKDYPGLMRSPSGQIVLGAFLAENWAADKWRTLFDDLARSGMPASFLPTFLNMRNATLEQLKLGPIVSEWSGNRIDAVPNAAYVDSVVRKNGRQWCAPVWPQDFRPKDGIYTEARNSALFRAGWTSAIENGADHVQIITWNDYSEASEIRPSTGIQYSFYDLAAYYIAWFKSGQQPKITRDVLYYFHRLQPVSSNTTRLRQKAPFKLLWDTQPRDEVELLAFLTRPGQMEIETGGQVYRMEAPAGIASMTAPLSNGRPSFRLKRANETVITFSSAFTITDHADFQDLLYRGGSSTRRALIDESQPG